MIIATINDLPGNEIQEAGAMGADAIVAFGLDTSDLGTTWTEICAYGTAVRARRL